MNLQRKILADGVKSLKILKTTLQDTESRIKKYVDQGGINNISLSEYEMIAQTSEYLLSGRKYQFQYKSFDMNLIDKTAIKLGFFQKETTNQYIKMLRNIFDV